MSHPSDSAVFPRTAAHALEPRDDADLADLLGSQTGPFELVGGGSKRALGRPPSGQPLVLRSLAGIIDYEPAELTLRAHAATPLGVVEQALAAARQRLAFEPPRYSKLLACEAEPTLGGVFAANLAGSRRVSAGAARDHLLGCRAVNGRGERFAAGGRVVKNVTGYDLPKLLAGSWGTLAVLTEVALRVAPAAETECTLAVAARTADEAVDLMSRALGSPCDVSCAAFDPMTGAMLRLEGFAASVRVRVERLRALLAAPDAALVTDDASRGLWARTGAAETLAECPVVWRISVPPSEAPRIVAELAPERYLLDWGGGLILAGFSSADAERVRSAATPGHATLLKAPVDARAAVRVFPPQPPAVVAFAARVKAAFDPDGKLNPGRMD